VGQVGGDELEAAGRSRSRRSVAAGAPGKLAVAIAATDATAQPAAAVARRLPRHALLGPPLATQPCGRTAAAKHTA
jgi:hypothetical protein